MHIDVLRAESLLANELDKSDYWRNDVMRYLASAREAAANPDFYVSIDLPGSPEQRLAAFRRQELAYGQLLIHWPTLVETARDMKGKGDMLAQPIQAYVN